LRSLTEGVRKDGGGEDLGMAWRCRGKARGIDRMRWRRGGAVEGNLKRINCTRFGERKVFERD